MTPTLQALLLLSIIPWVLGLATPPLAGTSKVGRMASPTTFGAVHFVKHPAQFNRALRQIRTEFTQAVTKLKLDGAPRKLIDGLALFEARLGIRLEQAQTQLDHLHDLMGTTHDPALRTQGPASQRRRSQPQHPEGSSSPPKEGASSATNNHPAELRQELGGRAHRRPRRQASLLVAGGAIVATTVLAVGLGIVHRIENVQDADDAYDSLTVSLRNGLRQETDQIRTNFNKINETLFKTRWQAEAHNAVEKTKAHVRLVDKRIEQWTMAFYHAMRGQLDPTFLAAEDLQIALKTLEKAAAQRGMRMVPFENPVEALFAMPSTVVRAQDGLHFFIPVPCIPERVPVFEVLHIEHQPVPLDKPGQFIHITVDPPFLAIDAERTMHAAIPAAELNSCPRFKDLFLCGRRQFYQRPQSCAAGIMYGDREAARHLCPKALVQLSSYAWPVGNASRGVHIWSGEEQTITRVCPNQVGEPLHRFIGHQVADLAPGCYIKTSDSFTFIPHHLTEERIPCLLTSWEREDLLEGMDLDDVLGVANPLSIAEVRLPLADVRRQLAHSRLVPGWHSSSIGGLTLLFVAAAGLILGRYVYLRRSPRAEDEGA